MWCISREYGHGGGGNGSFNKVDPDYSGQYSYPHADWGTCASFNFDASRGI